MKRLKSLLRDARHYDALHAYRKEDIPFWMRIADEYGGPILELGCGTGRIAIPIARQGHQVVGLDHALSMLEAAQAKGRAVDTVRWVHGEMADFNLGKPFALVIAPFNAFALLVDPAQAGSCLDAVARHLQPGGRFVIDIGNPDAIARPQDPDAPIAEYRSASPDGDGDIYTSVYARHDPARHVTTIHLQHGMPSHETIAEDYELRLYTPAQLRRLLAQHGLVAEITWGDYDRSPLDARSPRQLVACRRA